MRTKKRRDLPRQIQDSVREHKARIKAQEGYSKVEGSRVVLGELDVQALLAQEAE